MKHRSIRLTDGSNLRININFGTLYYIKKEHLDGLMTKEDLTEDEEFELTAKLIYVILRSNGRTVTFDEALMLCPLGTHEIRDMLTEFKNQLNDYKKKRGCEEADETEIQINWAEYVLLSKEMGMNEDEFWNSNPIFFNEMADIYLEKKKKEAKQISNLFK